VACWGGERDLVACVGGREEGAWLVDSNGTEWLFVSTVYLILGVIVGLNASDKAGSSEIKKLATIL
jgi:hypothetical protein